jgi:hypothetical protein
MAEDKNDRPLGYPNLRPIKRGEVRNSTGRNGKVRLDELREYLNEKTEPSSRHTRRENILLALYSTSIDRRRRDHVAAARVLLAYDLGLPAQALQVDHSNTDGSMLPAVIRVYPVKPREEDSPPEPAPVDDP